MKWIERARWPELARLSVPRHGNGVCSVLNAPPALRRLLQLENAVMYYGGGWDVLVARVNARGDELRLSDPESARLLDEVAVYLRDVASAGSLMPSRLSAGEWMSAPPDPEREVP